MVKFPDITITSIETITAFNVATGAYRFTLDELQNVTIAQSEETTDITGKAGRKLNSLKRNKGVTISGTNGLMSGGLLEAQTGGTFENKDTEILWTDYLTVESAKATTTYKAVGTAGAEIESLFIRNTNGTLGDELEQNATTDAGKFTYEPTSKALTFNEDVADGTEIVVYYKRKIVGDVLVNESDTYSEKLTLYVDCLGEDKCANVYRVQLYIPKADFSGEFSIELGDNQTTHDFEAESLAGGACGLGSQFWSYTVFGVDTEDAA